MTTGKKFLVAGGAVLFSKGAYLSVLLIAGALAPALPVVLGAVAETLIGLGIILSDLVEPLRHPKVEVPLFNVVLQHGGEPLLDGPLFFDGLFDEDEDSPQA